MRLTPKTYLHSFAIIVMILGVLRLTTDIEHFTWSSFSSSEPADTIASDTIIEQSQQPSDAIADNDDKDINTDVQHEVIAIAQPGPDFKPHRILSVPNYDDAFPDQNDIQLIAAQKNGVKVVFNREDVEKRKGELVYVGSSPYFHVDRLRSSIPYLVPKAAILLQDIGRIYYDSLVVKGVPLHKIIATSILRSKEDIEKLRRYNPNATENSCHLYGTTFDIAQNRFKTVEDPNGPKRRQVTNDTLKWVLAEVLRDMRANGRCYVKYERKQGCFHISVR